MFTLKIFPSLKAARAVLLCARVWMTLMEKLNKQPIYDAFTRRFLLAYLISSRVISARISATDIYPGRLYGAYQYHPSPRCPHRAPKNKAELRTGLRFGKPHSAAL